jgi:predicted nucleic acid-binding protein
VTRPSIADTTIISNFLHVQQMALLRLVFNPIYIPPAVLNELAHGVVAGHLPESRWNEWLNPLTLTSQEQASVDALYRNLGAGESECMAVATSRQILLLTDDLDARKVAHTMGIAISGTLGALVALIEMQAIVLDQADSLLLSMRQRGYHSPVDSLSELLDLPL